MKRPLPLSCRIILCLAAASATLLQAQQTPTPSAQDSMQDMAEHSHTPAQRSIGLRLTLDGKTVTLSLADLEAMPQKTVAVHNEHTRTNETYTGVPLGDLLAKNGFPVDKTTHRRMLRSYLIAEGTDKYWVLYSVTEIEASEHNADVIVATSMDGKPLGSDGALKLIDSDDRKPQRWVRNLSEVTLKSAE
jgi:hypothetical protein